MNKRPDKCRGALGFRPNWAPSQVHKEISMFRKIWVLLKPFHRAFFTLILLAIVGEGAQIVISYTVSLIVSPYILT